MKIPTNEDYTAAVENMKEMKKEYRMTIVPALRPSERHSIEDFLASRGYIVWAGGTHFKMSKCDISFYAELEPNYSGRDKSKLSICCATDGPSVYSDCDRNETDDERRQRIKSNKIKHEIVDSISHPIDENRILYRCSCGEETEDEEHFNRYIGDEMTTHALTEDDRKRLTEFLCERWLTNQECIDSYASNRNFATPDDRQALCEKLVERGMWDMFMSFALFSKECLITGLKVERYAYWLLIEQPERCCKLISEFLKEGKKL